MCRSAWPHDCCMDGSCFEKFSGTLQRTPLQKLCGSDGQVYTSMTHNLENVACDGHLTHIIDACSLEKALASQAVWGVFPKISVGTTLLEGDESLPAHSAFGNLVSDEVISLVDTGERVDRYVPGGTQFVTI